MASAECGLQGEVASLFSHKRIAVKQTQQGLFLILQIHERIAELEREEKDLVIQRAVRSVQQLHRLQVVV